ncbi:MAG: hypothetical protein ABIC40_05360, partial [bacterium]
LSALIKMSDSSQKYINHAFEGIIGQRVPIRTLSGLIESSRLPGTFLFSGPGGLGKLATALALAKALHCTEGSEKLCTCQSCRAIRSGTHPDVIVLSRDQTIGVGDMRELTALAQLRSAPNEERIIIIDRAENITQAASNAALKTLEEPGKHIRFVLITDTPASVLPTVRSRSYGVRFSLLSREEMAEFARSIGDNPSDDLPSRALRFAIDRPGYYLRHRFSEEYREVVAEITDWIQGVTENKRAISVRNAIKWKGEFREFAGGLSGIERKIKIPRGGDVFEMREYFRDPSTFAFDPVNWRADDRSAAKKRWGEGRQILLLSSLIRRIFALELDSRTAEILSRLQDFTEKVRYNCSFDIALERLYFNLAGL